MSVKDHNTNQYKPSILGLYYLNFPIQILIICIVTFILCSCSDSPTEVQLNPTPEPADTVTILKPSDIKDYNKYYKPKEFSSMDVLRSDSKWSFVRSKQSEHFIVFWELGFGLNPNADTVPEALRVDIDDLLKKAEMYYDINVNRLKFANVGSGKSNLDKYKMQIYLIYQTDWLATGAGYDDMIGALWVNPSTCKPVGSTIAHEIGHSFQYQVYADLLANGECQNDFSRGFRYGFGGNGGNGFWEQTAQWQSFQSYPNEVFTSYNFNEYLNNSHRHIGHEWQRYASYFIHYYWTDKHGIDFIGKLWREAVAPEDAMGAYMRVNNLPIDAFNAEIYDASSKFVTWDIESIRSYGRNYVGKHKYGFYPSADGAYQVAYSHCLGTTGYNAIPLNIPEAGTKISTRFKGLESGSALAAKDPGICIVNDKQTNVRNYNKVSVGKSGWRYGYVALLKNGNRVYGEMNKDSEATVSFIVPENCDKLWFVVTGAPSEYKAHPWDDDESNDEQWPYTIKFINTDILGNMSFTGDETPHDLELNFELSFPASTSEYTGTTVEISGDNLVKLAKALVLQPNDIKSVLGGKMKFYGIESDNTLNAKTTANGYGHWFDISGNICSWGDTSVVFSEFDESGLLFTLGQYPGHNKAGDIRKIRQALVYEYATGKKVQITFTFNILIK